MEKQQLLVAFDVNLGGTRNVAEATPAIIFNIGNGYVTPFEEVLAALKALCPGVSYEIDAGAMPHESLAPLDISAAKRHLGWEPWFTIASALEDYVKELAAARAS